MDLPVMGPVGGMLGESGAAGGRGGPAGLGGALRGAGDLGGRVRRGFGGYGNSASGEAPPKDQPPRDDD